MRAMKSEVDPEKLKENPIGVSESASEDYLDAWHDLLEDDYANAVKSFEKAVEKDPENCKVLYTLALAHKAKGEKQEAINLFEQVLAGLEGTESPTEKSVLRHLTTAQINHIKTGVWKAEI